MELEDFRISRTAADEGRWFNIVEDFPHASEPWPWRIRPINYPPFVEWVQKQKAKEEYSILLEAGGETASNALDEIFKEGFARFLINGIGPQISNVENSPNRLIELFSDSDYEWIWAKVRLLASDLTGNYYGDIPQEQLGKSVPSFGGTAVTAGT